MQEGSKAKVQTGTSVITDVTETIVDNTRTFSTTRRNAGLTLSLEVAKIDDNGFVTLSVNPKFLQRRGRNRGFVVFITERKLESGDIRLRDRHQC